MTGDTKYEGWESTLAFFNDPVHRELYFPLAHLNMWAATGEGILYKNNGSSLPFSGGVEPKRGEWAIQTLPSGLVRLTSNDWTVKREWRRQLRCFSMAERTFLNVLQGAGSYSASTIDNALEVLGLGEYHSANPLIENMVRKGYMTVLPDATLILSKNRQWVKRPALPDHAGERPICWKDWPSGVPSRSNPLYLGAAWHEVVCWPARRGGRPPLDPRQ